MATGSTYQRGNIWWIRYYHNGERYRESSGSEDQADAERLLRKRLDQVEMRGPNPSDEMSITIRDLRNRLIRDYKARGLKSIDEANRAMDRVEEVLGDGTRAVDVGHGDLLSYIEQRLEQDAARSTIQVELSMLRRAYSVTVEAGDLRSAPSFPSVKVDNVRTNWLSMQDVDDICEELDDNLTPVVRFGALTGWRKNEILDIEWSEVDFDAGMIRLEPGTTKNDEGRTFPFGALPPLESLLYEQRGRTDQLERDTGQIVPWVFHRSGDRIKSLRDAWNAACERAGVPEAVFHDLRRTAVRNLERAGVSRSVAMKLTGHKTESVYKRYAIADEDALAEGAAKLAELHGSDDSQGERRVVSINDRRD